MLEQPVAEKKAPLKCDHGRQKSQCKDCGTGHCQHGRQKSQCRDCLAIGIGNRQYAIAFFYRLVAIAPRSFSTSRPEKVT